jgi:hypothetical protein
VLVPGLEGRYTWTAGGQAGSAVKVRITSGLMVPSEVTQAQGVNLRQHASCRKRVASFRWPFLNAGGPRMLLT